MKRCPDCGRDYNDDSMSFCLDDGSELLFGPASVDEPPTAIMSEPPASADGQFGDEPATAILSGFGIPPLGGEGAESPTRAQIQTTDQTAILRTGTEAEPQKSVGEISEKHRFWHKKRASVADAGNRSANRAAKPLAALVVAVLVLVGGFFGYRYFSAASSTQINSIAVMPFENRNSDSDTDYLSDGLAESVIFRLTQIPDLKVSPTSSVMRYKGKETDVAKIASELGVDAVMTGRLTKRGDILNITVELVDARTNKSLWGEQYERKLSELLTTQREIVAEIVGKLQLKLSGESEQNLAKKYTDNPEAYQLYLKGRFAWNKRTGTSLKQAAEFFKQATEKDPSYALAYSGLAETYELFGSYSVTPTKESMPLAKAAAERALELDSSLADPHTALEMYFSYAEYDRVAGEREIRRAIELNPNYATAHQWLGSDLLTPTKRFDESLASLRRAAELDPLSPIIATNLGDVFLFSRRYDEALDQYRRTQTIDPNFPLLYFGIAQSQWMKGLRPDAVAQIRRYIELSGGDPVGKGELAFFLCETGQRAEAHKILSELQEDATKGYVASYAFALVYLGLDDKEKAYEWLDKEIDEHGMNATYYAVNPELDRLRPEPRFKAMLKRLNLPE